MSHRSLSKNDLFAPLNRVLTSTGWRQLVNADIATGAAIAYAKLALGASIVNADIAAGAAIAYSKLSLAASIVNADVAAAAAIAVTKLALGAANTILASNGTTNSFTTTPTIGGTATIQGGLNVGTATGAATGDLRLSGSVYPGNQATMYMTVMYSGSLAANTSAALGPASSRSGFVFVHDYSDGKSGIFSIADGFNTSTILVNDGAQFDNSGTPNNSKIQVYFSGGTYFLYNGFPATSKILYVAFLGI